MEFILFIVLAVVLYFVADFVLRQAEARAGRRFEYRTIYFFVLLLLFALGAFRLVRWVFGEG